MFDSFWGYTHNDAGLVFAPHTIVSNIHGDNTFKTRYSIKEHPQAQTQTSGVKLLI